MLDITQMLPVGKHGLQVPRLGLGTAPLGNMYAPIGEAQAVETIQTAYAAGVRFFDTAPLYGAGQSERYLGRALAGVPRASFRLATKVGRLVDPDGRVYFDFSRDGVRRSFEDSLERLGLERIDILHLHDPDDHYQQALDEAYPVLAEWREQGLIGAVGAGMNQWPMLAEFARHADFDCFLLAGRYTLLEQGGLAEFWPLCQERQIAVFVGGVFNSGILASGTGPAAKYNYADAPAEVQARVERLEAICARHGVPLKVAAVQFPTAHPAVSSLILGAVSGQEVRANLDGLGQPLPAALWADLKTESLLDPAAPVPV